MYTVDDQDTVLPEVGLPRSSVGAPIPLLVANEGTAVLAYYMLSVDPNWDGTSVRMVSAEDADDDIAIVRFDRCYATMFGPPNNEAFAGHPLAARGLRPYSAFRVERSSWLRRLERMNSVHPHHSAAPFAALNHYILTFHDSTFECLAGAYAVSHAHGSIMSAFPKISGSLRDGG